MNNERMFLKCEICGNIVGMIENAGPAIECCGQEMTELIPNTEDAAHEKHVPVIVRDGNVVEVSIGSVPHPMIEAHHICWVVLAGHHWTQRRMLNAGDPPVAVFSVATDDKLTAYAYCNLHGLWAAESE